MHAVSIIKQAFPPYLQPSYLTFDVLFHNHIALLLTLISLFHILDYPFSGFCIPRLYTMFSVIVTQLPMNHPCNIIVSFVFVLDRLHISRLRITPDKSKIDSAKRQKFRAVCIQE